MISIICLIITCALVSGYHGRYVGKPDSSLLEDIFGKIVHPIKWSNFSWKADVKGPMTVHVSEKKSFVVPSFSVASGEKECSDILMNNPKAKSKVYSIRPIYSNHAYRSFRAYCDMETDGGGWTVFQRRFDGSEYFNRTYREYSVGFGNLTGEYWLGNDIIHAITQVGKYQLRIQMETFDDVKLWAKYTTFKVGDSKSGYKLTVSGFSGNAIVYRLFPDFSFKKIPYSIQFREDSMTYHNGARFTTSDKDQDTWKYNCASYYTPFWHKACMNTTPNGYYMKSGSYTAKDGRWGIAWYTYKKSWNISMKKFAMMVKRVN